MTTLLPNLKAEYAEVLRRVDLEETPLPRVATDLAITTNNATVRLHRARQALRRQLERSCGTCATHRLSRLHLRSRGFLKYGSFVPTNLRYRPLRATFDSSGSCSPAEPTFASPPRP
jgi:hypothetical protein